MGVGGVGGVSVRVCRRGESVQGVGCVGGESVQGVGCVGG